MMPAVLGGFGPKLCWKALGRDTETWKQARWPIDFVAVATKISLDFGPIYGGTADDWEENSDLFVAKS